MVWALCTIYMALMGSYTLFCPRQGHATPVGKPIMLLCHAKVVEAWPQEMGTMHARLLWSHIILPSTCTFPAKFA